MELTTTASKVISVEALRDFLVTAVLFGVKRIFSRDGTTARFYFDEHEILVGSTYMQILIDNDVDINKAEFYSPLFQVGALATEIPTSWPNSAILDEAGEVVRQKTLEEYAQYHEVEGGYICRFSGGAKDENNNIPAPNNAQLRVWLAQFNGNFTSMRAGRALIASSNAEA